MIKPIHAARSWSLRTSVIVALLPCFFCILTPLRAQIESPIAQDQETDVIRETPSAFLLQMARRDSIRYHAERDSAIRVALRLGRPVEGSRNGRSFSLQGFDGAGDLYYHVSANSISAAVHGTDQLYPNGDAGLSLTGAGRTLGVWEVGRPRLTHVEYGGRVIQADNSTAPISNHANHVCGTMIAAGVEPEARGMAYEANLRASDTNNDASEMATGAAAPVSLRVSNHSYGAFSGWDYEENDSPQWSWFGNTAVSQTTDYKFGHYNSQARDYDNVAHSAPFYLPVFAAANDRDDSGPGPGGEHWVQNASGQWVLSTTTRQPDGGTSGYDCLAPSACAKNILTVGAVEATFENGLVVYSMSDFSSWGPTDDGRIKPDIVARGVDVFSTGGASNTHYYLSQGTSMAAPAVAGSLELLLQHYTNLNPGFTIRASALKGLVVHTATASDGPDYQQGWGLLNTRAAADLISSSFVFESRDRLISRDSLTNGSTRELNYYHDGATPFKVTVAWTDPAGPVAPVALGPTTPRLVNDLDVRLIRQQGGTTYLPWRLNPASPSLNATKGDNFRDNVEQVYEENLPAGMYTVRITHKGTLSGGVQYFSTMLSGRSTLLTACSGALSDGSGNNDYFNNCNYSWTISPPNAASVTLNFSAFNTENNLDFVRVYDGTDSNAPLLGEFSGTDIPPALTATSGNMYIVFTTDESITESGWSANYTCAAAHLSVSPTSLNFGANGGSNTIAVTANCPWVISNIPAWLTVVPTNGNANATVQISCMPNPTQQNRTVTLQITACNGLEETVFVTQSACTQPAAPVVSASGPTALCPGQTVTLTASNVCSGCLVLWSNGQTGLSITVSAAGDYSATVSNACGQSPASNVVSVSVGAVPAAPV
ncbi:MAG: S8 family serine peptidase, partial [Saprospiraceae bacterium]